jgi:thiol-disulfide isomerase/thioredoxin
MRFKKCGLMLMVVFLSATMYAQFTAAPPLYPDGDAKPAIRLALAQAAQTHKHVLLDFGGNWCPDCKALDIYFHQPGNDALLEKNYIVVHVNIGHYDMNLDVAQRYGVPLKKGVPALVVLISHGMVLVAQRGGEFENMRNMQSASVTEFLTKWKPAR